MKVLLLGGSGATGKLVAQELVSKGASVKMIVRSKQKIEPYLQNSAFVELIEGNVHQLSQQELADHLEGCCSVISCLGHNLTFTGMFGQPRRLVTETLMRTCQAIHQMNHKHRRVKLILMSTTGYQNHEKGEKVSLAHKLVLGLIRLLIPPHSDNEQAAQYLQHIVAYSDMPIEWVCVRPDSLTLTPLPTEYEIHSSPVCDPIFNSRPSSRYNVAHFMVALLTKQTLWEEWKNELPVIYDSPIRLK
ncbi:NAD(P)-binding oxidoreductase [Marinomonas epiphytica]